MRSDLDDLGRYMYTQMLIWRDLNQFLGWGSQISISLKRIIGGRPWMYRIRSWQKQLPG